MTRNRIIITGPDIDKLAHGVYAPEVLTLTNQVKDLTGQVKAQRQDLKQVRGDLKKRDKQLRGALNHKETLLAQLAEVKDKREQLIRDNKRLRAQLLNHNITPLEESNGAS